MGVTYINTNFSIYHHLTMVLETTSTYTDTDFGTSCRDVCTTKLLAAPWGVAAVASSWKSLVSKGYPSDDGGGGSNKGIGFS